MTKRIISFALCLLLLAAAVPFSAVSAETLPETPKALAAEELPDAMIGKISEKTLVARASELEDAPCSLAFYNDDGTVSLFMFSEPVKYTAADGTVKDKSTALSEQNGAFRSGDNDFSAVLPYGAAEGVTVSYGEYAVTFKANGAYDSRGVKTGRDCVIYANIFENVSLRYTMLLNGMKEDIILTSPECSESVSFTVYTNGLSLSEYEDGYYFAAGSEKLFKLGELTVEDSSGVFDEKEYAHEMTVEVVEDGEEYKVTLTVDRAYLNDPARVYPVYVDPTITLNTTTQIEDTTLFSGQPTSNYGGYKNVRTGYYNTTYKQSYTLMRFPGLTSYNYYNQCNASDITSANLYLYSQGTHTSSTWAQANFYSGNSWNENSVTFNSAGSNFSAPGMMGNTSVSSGYTGYVSIDVLYALKTWKGGTPANYPLSKGICLIGPTTSGGCLNLKSSEATSNTPYLTVVINVPGTVTISDAPNGHLIVGQTCQLDASISPSYLPQNVTWTSSMPSVATVDSDGLVTATGFGYANITATFADGSASVIIYVDAAGIAEIKGIYKLKYNNKYLYSEMGTGGVTTIGMKAPELTVDLDEAEDSSVLWAIVQLTSGYYSIISMHTRNYDTVTYGYYDYILSSYDAVNSNLRVIANLGYSIQNQWQVEFSNNNQNCEITDWSGDYSVYVDLNNNPLLSDSGGTTFQLIEYTPVEYHPGDLLAGKTTVNGATHIDVAIFIHTDILDNLGITYTPLIPATNTQPEDFTVVPYFDYLKTWGMFFDNLNINIFPWAGYGSEYSTEIYMNCFNTSYCVFVNEGSTNKSYGSNIGYKTYNDTADLDESLLFSLIILNNTLPQDNIDYNYYNQSIAQQKHILLHELGHALKIRHPDKIYFTTPDYSEGDYHYIKPFFNPACVMNHSIQTGSCRITVYDYLNISNKWE